LKVHVPSLGEGPHCIIMYARISAVLFPCSMSVPATPFILDGWLTVHRRYYVDRSVQLDATQWFSELVICSTRVGHYYAHHQELETIQKVTACGTWHLV
jgi:hypothetical protein